MKALKWLNTGAFVLMIAVNALAELLPLGGNTTGQVSEAYPNLFTPAPVTFAVWGLIYLMMLLFIIYQHGVFDGGGQSSAQVRDRIGIWFSVSCLLNILWIFLWHYRLMGLSTLCIAMLLISLCVIVSRTQGSAGDLKQMIMAEAGFSLYFGWIIAATIANICVYLTALGWKGWGISADIWTVIVLLAGAVIAGAAALIKHNRIAAIAVMWAYAGILIRHISPAYLAGSHPYVIAAAIVSEALILLAILLPLFMLRCKNRAVSEIPADEQEDL